MLLWNDWLLFASTPNSSLLGLKPKLVLLPFSSILPTDWFSRPLSPLLFNVFACVCKAPFWFELNNKLLVWLVNRLLLGCELAPLDPNRSMMSFEPLLVPADELLVSKVARSAEVSRNGLNGLSFTCFSCGREKRKVRLCGDGQKKETNVAACVF